MSSDSEPTRAAAHRHWRSRAPGTAQRPSRRTRRRDGSCGASAARAGASQCASSWSSVRRWSTSSLPARTATVPSWRRVTPVECSPARVRHARRGSCTSRCAHTTVTSSRAQAGAVIDGSSGGSLRERTASSGSGVARYIGSFAPNDAFRRSLAEISAGNQHAWRPAAPSTREADRNLGATAFHRAQATPIRNRPQGQEHGLRRRRTPGHPRTTPAVPRPAEPSAAPTSSPSP